MCSVVNMKVKDIEKKIYSSDRGWFGDDDGEVSGSGWQRGGSGVTEE